MATGFIQIFKQNYICGTTHKHIPQTLILVTGEKQYLKITGIVNEDCMQMASQTKFIDVITTLQIPIDCIKQIFRHAKDKILDVVIADQTINIIGDTGILYSQYISNNISNLERKEIILMGSKPWLQTNDLECF